MNNSQIAIGIIANIAAIPILVKIFSIYKSLNKEKDINKVPAIMFSFIFFTLEAWLVYSLKYEYRALSSLCLIIMIPILVLLSSFLNYAVEDKFKFYFALISSNLTFLLLFLIYCCLSTNSVGIIALIGNVLTGISSMPRGIFVVKFRDAGYINPYVTFFSTVLLGTVVSYGFSVTNYDMLIVIANLVAGDFVLFHAIIYVMARKYRRPSDIVSQNTFLI